MWVINVRMIHNILHGGQVLAVLLIWSITRAVVAVAIFHEIATTGIMLRHLQKIFVHHFSSYLVDFVVTAAARVRVKVQNTLDVGLWRFGLHSDGRLRYGFWHQTAVSVGDYKINQITGKVVKNILWRYRDMILVVAISWNIATATTALVMLQINKTAKTCPPCKMFYTINGHRIK